MMSNSGEHLIARRASRKWRIPTECRKGHIYGDGDFKPNGQRLCRQCKKERALELRRETGKLRAKRDLERERVLRAQRLASCPERRARQAAAMKARYARHGPKPANVASRLRATFRIRVHRVIPDGRRGAWLRVLGYTMPELMAHLERQFAKGMSWANYGVWQVDHILPLSSFKYDSIDHPDYHAAWALTNLRPLWAEDNYSKSGKRLHLI